MQVTSEALQASDIRGAGRVSRALEPLAKKQTVGTCVIEWETVDLLPATKYSTLHCPDEEISYYIRKGAVPSRWAAKAFAFWGVLAVEREV